MKTVYCKTCGKEIAKSAKICPNCGAKNKGKAKGLRIVIAVLLILAGIGTLFGNSSTNENEDKKDTTVTMDEFMQIETGMSYDDVVKIIGFDGTLNTQVDLFNDGDKTEIYEWKNAMSGVVITFQGGVVTTKTQHGLE